jgi:hypothetical protein
MLLFPVCIKSRGALYNLRLSSWSRVALRGAESLQRPSLTEVTPGEYFAEKSLRSKPHTRQTEKHGGGASIRVG